MYFSNVIGSDWPPVVAVPTRTTPPASFSETVSRTFTVLSLSSAIANSRVFSAGTFAESDEIFERLIGSIESVAVRLKLRRVALRCQTAYASAYKELVRRGYRVRWTDLRMTLAGFPEVAVPEGEVLLSNWEI